MFNWIPLNKNLSFFFISLIVNLLLLTGCWGYPYPPNIPSLTILPIYLTEIMVQPSTMDLKKGESQPLVSVTASYSDSSTADIPLDCCTYYSYHPSCANINSSGLITGMSTGTAVISVIYTENSISKTDTVNINVTNVAITPTFLSYIEVLPSVMSLKVGESKTISSVTAFYDNINSKNINLNACNYDSSNPACSTVSNSGSISGISEGTAVITVSYSENEIIKTDTLEVTIGAVTQNEVAYRALCVGVGDYILGSDNDLLAPPYDVDRMVNTLNKCRFGWSNTPFSNIWYLKDWQATKSNILYHITSKCFIGADNNDISYFYFSGHGSLVGNTSYLCPADMTSFADSTISVNELENALSTIPGTKVVFIDTCHSGGFIGKGAAGIQFSKEELESFNDEIVNVFSQAEYKGLLTTNQYIVLTSCHSSQESMELSPVIPGDFDPFGVFTKALCEGCGYDGSYPADTNLDTRVSLQEAYLYVKFYVEDLNTQISYINITQDVQVYPNNSSFAIVEF